MKLSHADIERIMAAHEFTQGSVAGAMGVRQPVLCRLLGRIRDGQDIRPATAGKLARALSCDIAQIEDRS